MDRQTDRHMVKRKSRRIDRWKDEWTDSWADRWTDKRTDGGTDRWMNEQMGKQTDGRTSCLTGLDQSVLKVKTKIVNYHTANSKAVKQEVNSTVVLPPLVFPGQIYTQMDRHMDRQSARRQMGRQTDRQMVEREDFVFVLKLANVNKALTEEETLLSHLTL